MRTRKTEQRKRKAPIQDNSYNDEELEQKIIDILSKVLPPEWMYKLNSK